MMVGSLSLSFGLGLDWVGLQARCVMAFRFVSFCFVTLRSATLRRYNGSQPVWTLCSTARHDRSKHLQSCRLDD
jgi:hypothetical protein